MEQSKSAQYYYQQWLSDPYFGESGLQPLEDAAEINDRFSPRLEFGTSGIRNLMEAGTNRINIYVIRKISQGLADYLRQQRCGNSSVVIAYDTRRHSARFARETALTLAQNGIKAYLFAAERPTPELSFALRYLQADAGVMITASHNPKQYNGYKAYGADGAQFSPADSHALLEAVSAREDWHIEVMAETAARARGLLVTIGAEVDEQYLAAVQRHLLQPALGLSQGHTLPLVYTPLHGTGGQIVPRLLAQCGFRDLLVVPEQAGPDGDFPTLAVPNPEDQSAFQLALQYACACDARLVIGTDPDADRMAALCRVAPQKYRYLSGNQTGLILLYYILSQLQANRQLPEHGVVTRSVVSTPLAERIAHSFGVITEIVPPGFRFVGEKIKRYEENGQATFIFGFEESGGFLKGTYCRDKDGVLACALLAEAALFYQQQQKTLADLLDDIYRQFGYLLDKQLSYSFYGSAGRETSQRLMQTLRKNPPSALAGLPVLICEDYQNPASAHGHATGPPELPPLNMLRFVLSDHSSVIIRPSGTEPKIRFYFQLAGPHHSAAQSKFTLLNNQLSDLLSGYTA